MSADRHDDLVAMVSHVPHLTAATLMTLAADAAAEHATLLRLAAGGFRDMTRIAAGHPGIWPDICVENRAEILETLDRLLRRPRPSSATWSATGTGPGSSTVLERARDARVNLPLRAPRPERGDSRSGCRCRTGPGVLAEVTTLLGEMDVNIFDLEIAHSRRGRPGRPGPGRRRRSSDRTCARALLPGGTDRRSGGSG